MIQPNPDYSEQSKLSDTSDLAGEATESLPPDKLNAAVEFVLAHLQKESEYLDTVIQCSLRMKDLLRRRSTQTQPDDPTVPDAANPVELAAGNELDRPDILEPHEQLTALRGDLARQFVPVLEGRQQMQSALGTVEPLLKNPPTAIALAAKLPDPQRRELKRLRLEIKDKLNEVRSITMGNQAVLLYTMDFYQRLLNGLSNEVPATNAYNADGRVASQVGPGLIKKDC
jgi:hypothetical protein